MQISERQKLVPLVRQILQASSPNYLTSHQILARLPDVERSQVIAEYGSGVGFISMILGEELFSEVKSDEGFDGRGIFIAIEGEKVELDYSVRLYKLHI